MKKIHRSHHSSKLVPQSTWPSILDTLSASSDHCIIVAPFGAKNTGKSTLLEYLIEASLPNSERDLFLL